MDAVPGADTRAEHVAHLGSLAVTYHSRPRADRPEPDALDRAIADLTDAAGDLCDATGIPACIQRIVDRLSRALEGPEHPDPERDRFLDAVARDL